MIKNRLITLSLKKIKNSFKRFLSLAVLSFLGVTVFVGIKMSNPDMMESIDTYFDSQNTYDIKVVSTLGLTDKDITYIEQQDSNLKVYGSHSKDTEFHVESKSEVIKLMEITNDVNKIIVKEGRLPTNKNEVAIESGIISKFGLKIGEKIYLDIEDDDKTINSKELTLVGTVISPTYALNSNGNINRGNTNLGVGDIDYYGCVTSDFFNMDYYTEIYITSNNKETTNSEEYNNFINNIMEEINSTKQAREKARKDEFVKEANEEINKKDKEGEKQFLEIKQQLDEAGNELASGKTKLDKTEKQLNSAKTQLNEAKTEIEDGRELLQNGENELNEAKATLDELKNEVEKEVSKYDLTYEDVCIIIDVINGRKLTRNEAIDLVPESLEHYESIIDIINFVYDNNYEKLLANFINDIKKEEFINKIPKSIDNYDEVVKYIKNLDTSKVRKRILQFFLNEKYIEEIKEKIPKNAVHYDNIIKALNQYETMVIKLKDLYNGIESLEKGFSLYQKNLKLFESKKQQLENGEAEYQNALNQYNDGLKEYNNGKKIYNDNLNLYNSKIEEYNLNYKRFNEEIEKARNEVESLESATWYLYNRVDNSDYASYLDSADSVERLATIFPTIFFIVAIFISSLSMARMAIEDRAEIGTLKSLGYGNMAIRGIYIFYATIATLIGGLLGALAGYFILPKVIFDTYKMMYEVPIFTYSTNMSSILLGIILSLICICGATIITINKLVKEKPTILLRPLSPNKGKKIFLEKINFIWKRLNFSNKITIRNIFRYKKRVGMTILGIMGCTTLLLSGYAIRDSIISVGKKHFEEILVFDEMFYLDGKKNKSELDEIFNSSHIKEKIYTKMSTIEVGTDSANLFVPQDADTIDNIVNLKDSKTKEKLKLEEGKVIVSSKLAKRNKLKVNDIVEFTDSQNNKYSFEVSGITENYVGNYIYMDSKTYEENISPYNINVCYIKLDDKSYEDSITEDLLKKNSNIISSIASKAILERFDKIFGALDSVVVILVVLSGALSFVVLYNLVYVSISERQREIATLKVLGFNHKEVDSYIIKEETIISIIGILIGLIIGTWYSSIIVETLEVPTVQFIKTITPKSYLITFGFMILFKLIVNIRVHFALKKIDMIESLKSIE